jgi:hypothetical protein
VLAERVATGTRSRWILPFAYALARFACEPAANASQRSLVIVGEPVVQVLRGRAHHERRRVDELLG